MLAGGIFRQENDLRNAQSSRSRAAQSFDFLNVYRLVRRFACSLRCLLAPVA